MTRIWIIEWLRAAQHAEVCVATTSTSHILHSYCMNFFCWIGRLHQCWDMWTVLQFEEACHRLLNTLQMHSQLPRTKNLSGGSDCIQYLSKYWVKIFFKEFNIFFIFYNNFYSAKINLIFKSDNKNICNVTKHFY